MRHDGSGGSPSIHLDGLDRRQGTGLKLVQCSSPGDEHQCLPIDVTCPSRSSRSRSGSSSFSLNLRKIKARPGQTVRGIPAGNTGRADLGRGEGAPLDRRSCGRDLVRRGHLEGEPIIRGALRSRAPLLRPQRIPRGFRRAYRLQQGSPPARRKSEPPPRAWPAGIAGLHFWAGDRFCPALHVPNSGRRAES